ncbi:MAG: deoxyribose-phosphate aldolase [Lentisphaerae bacterium]|nr:deoxyribose-phosphate aldolase [Lentisphaerota bacterium]
MAEYALSEAGRGIAPLIDHTNLKPDATERAIAFLCEEAVACGFAAVCVHPCRLPYVASILSGSAVRPCTVVGFPLGANTPEAKAFEASDAVSAGAMELDMVINVGAIKDGNTDAARADIRAVVNAAGRAPVKVIIETALLTDAEKVLACRLAAEAGAAFVKTCTGFSGGAATETDIRLMRGTVGSGVGVKASGGIRDLKTALAMVAAGANRIGTSSGLAIVTG